MKSPHTQKIQHMCLAMRLADLNVNEDTVVLITRLVDLIERKGGRSDLRDVASIKSLWLRDVPMWEAFRQHEMAEAVKAKKEEVAKTTKKKK